jgi:YHS domain-containing protein
VNRTLIIFLSTSICAALLAVGCDHPAASSASTAPSTAPVAASNGAINKYCAVETDNKIDPNGVTYQYKGKIIGFCCPDCVDTFKKDPEKYMATLH